MLQLFSLSAPVGLAWLGPPFIARWMGQQYADAGFWVLMVLCAGFFFEGIASNSNRLLLATASHGRIAALSIISAPACLALSIPLGARWGIAGVAGAVALYLAGQALAELYNACSVLNISVSGHLRKTVLPYITPLALLALTLGAMSHFLEPDTYARIGLIGLSGMVVFVSTSMATAWRREERAALWTWLVQIIRRAPPQGQRS